MIGGFTQPDKSLFYWETEFAGDGRSMSERENWLDDVMRVFACRQVDGEAGERAPVTRPSQAMLSEFLRNGMARRDALRDLMQAFRDRHIGQALEHIHLDPARDWTVQRLARAVGMSRSAFAERFREMTGAGPMGYLADWRLQRALALLEQTDHAIQQIANYVGYQSAASFTRAFVGKFGRTPSAMRRAALAG